MMKRIISALMIICISVVMLSSCGAGSSTPDSRSNGKLTLMIYMVGSDLESKHMAASNDITEILDSGLDPSKVNLLIHTGGSTMWYYDIPCDTNATYLLTGDTDGTPTLEQVDRTDELKNMADPETLSAFLNYGYTNYSAERYGLICWDHGNGPILGFGKDSLFDDDKMDLAQMQKAMASSPFNAENKLDFIGFDACLMSSLEVASTLSDYADYMIASQDLEPGDGWCYSFLKELNDPIDVPRLAEVILNRFNEYYEAKRSATFNPNLTLACLDLSKIGAVSKAMDDLFGAMTASLDKGDYYHRAIERSRARSFGDASYSNRGVSLDLVDAGSLARECSSSFKKESGELQSALESFVILNQTNLSDASGVSLYYPYYGTDLYEREASERYKSLTDSENYRSYLEGYIKEWTQARKNNDTGAAAVPKTDISDDSMTYHLTEEQKKTFSKAYLNLYSKEKDASGYELLLLGSPLYPDDSGDLLISADQKVPAINGRHPIALAQRSSAEGVNYYESLGTCVVYEEGDVFSGEYVTIRCSLEDNSDEITINSIEYNNQKTGEKAQEDIARGSQGKSTVDVSMWDALAFPCLSAKLTKDDNGKVLPFSDWKSDGSYLWRNYPLSEVVGLSMLSINEIPGYTADNFYYQVVIEDSSGNRQWGEPIQFKKAFETTKVTQKSPKGVYTYTLYPDHAKLEKYEGTDDDLIIPDTVENLPVTEISYRPFQTNAFQKSGSSKTIASLTIENPQIQLRSVDFSGIRRIYLPKGMTDIPNQAFRSADRVEEIVIPDTVSQIGYHAFANMNSLKKLELPAGVTHIGYGAFCNSPVSGGVSFKGNNDNYVIRDGMLLSKDGKQLHTVFPSKAAELTIPDGVEEILPYAHKGGEYLIPDGKGEYLTPDYSLSHIIFPESLRYIRYHAFEGENLNELILPDGVEEIGNLAFTDCGVSSNHDLKVVDNLTFGIKLRRLGFRILGGSRFGTINISDKNLYFAVKDNMLTNKHKDAELSEIELSGSNNLTRNKTEYDIYQTVTDGLDMSLYKKSALQSDNKTYDGHDYSLYLELNDENRFTYKHPGADITLCGVDITLPDSFDKLRQTGLEMDEDSAAKKTIKYAEHVLLKDKNGDSITASLKDDSGEDVPIEESKIEALEFQNRDFSSDDRRIHVDFSYHGVTCDSSLQDIIKALGSPSEIEISLSELEIADTSYAHISLRYESFKSTGQFVNTNFHTHEETHHISDGGCTIELDYEPETGKSVINRFTLNSSEE